MKTHDWLVCACSTWFVLSSAASEVAAQTQVTPSKSWITIGSLLKQEHSITRPAARRQTQVASSAASWLVGIWGIAPRLYAQVWDRGRKVEFVQGNKRALEPYQHRYVLIALNPPCIRYRAHGRLQRACLRTK